MGDKQLAGQSVIGVAARGSTSMVATFEERDPSLTQANGALYGLYISTDGGQSWDRVKPDSGLPAGPVTALVADPSSSTTFYAAITSPTTKDLAGVYVTYDSGSLVPGLHRFDAGDRRGQCHHGYNRSAGTQACDRAVRLGRDSRRRLRREQGPDADRPVFVAEPGRIIVGS
jgi:hypothetical protein